MKLTYSNKTVKDIQFTNNEQVCLLKILRDFHATTYDESMFKANLWRMILINE